MQRFGQMTRGEFTSPFSHFLGKCGGNEVCISATVVFAAYINPEYKRIQLYYCGRR